VLLHYSITRSDRILSDIEARYGRTIISLWLNTRFTSADVTGTLNICQEEDEGCWISYPDELLPTDLPQALIWLIQDWPNGNWQQHELTLIHRLQQWRSYLLVFLWYDEKILYSSRFKIHNDFLCCDIIWPVSSRPRPRTVKCPRRFLWSKIIMSRIVFEDSVTIILTKPYSKV